MRTWALVALGFLAPWARVARASDDVISAHGDALSRSTSPAALSVTMPAGPPGYSPPAWAATAATSSAPGSPAPSRPAPASHSAALVRPDVAEAASFQASESRSERAPLARPAALAERGLRGLWLPVSVVFGLLSALVLRRRRNV